MKTIKLTGKYAKGRSVIVDKEDYKKYSSYSWYAVDKGNNRIYAVKSKRVGLRSNNKSIKIYLHREIMNPKVGEYVDHINRNTLDNRKENLRICSNAENTWNQKGHFSQRKYSKFKGVKKNRNCSTWSARLTFHRKVIYLGSFKTELEAAKAYNDAAKYYYGEFACLNNL